MDAGVEHRRLGAARKSLDGRHGRQEEDRVLDERAAGLQDEAGGGPGGATGDLHRGAGGRGRAPSPSPASRLKPNSSQGVSVTRAATRTPTRGTIPSPRATSSSAASSSKLSTLIHAPSLTARRRSPSGL